MDGNDLRSTARQTRLPRPAAPAARVPQAGTPRRTGSSRNGSLFGHPLRRAMDSESGATHTRPGYTGGEGLQPVFALEDDPEGNCGDDHDGHGDDQPRMLAEARVG